VVSREIVWLTHSELAHSFIKGSRVVESTDYR
jgi:hypothetical protein